VTRIDPVTGEKTRTAIPAIAGASSIAVGFGRVWIVSPPAGKVIALDPRSGNVLKEISVGTDPAGVAVGADAIWVANRADGTVSRIDPRALAVTGLARVGRDPTGIAVAQDDVWVTNAGDGTLSRFDPSNVGEVESLELGNPPRGIALSSRGVYVAVGSSGAEHRGGQLEVLTDELDFVDPALVYTASSWSALTMTNDGLVGFRKVGGAQGIQLVPDLAISLPTITDGGKTYTFQLRRASATRTGDPCDRRTFGAPSSGSSSSAPRGPSSTTGSSVPIAVPRGSRATSLAVSSPIPWPSP
jgi:peptide/nickel transport system substrate-binding protein